MSLSIDLGKKVQRPGQVLDGEDDPIAVTVVGYVGKLGVGNETVREPMKVFCTAQN
jgi:hypothetical protein